MERAQVQDDIDRPTGHSEEQESLNHQLLEAVWDCDTTAISSLLQHGADVNLEDGTILLCGVMQDDDCIAAASLLINHGANVNAVDAGGESALMHVARPGSTALLRLLYVAGADIQLTDDGGENALMKATSLHPSRSIIQQLVEWGCYINAQDNTGQTALHHCLSHDCYADDPACVTLLLQLGADPNIQDATGRNALHLAIQSCCPLDTLTLLADKMTDINAADSQGTTALLHAMEREGDAENVVQMLIDHRADVHVRDSYGNTPLHYVTVDNESLRKLLICAGSDVMAANNDNQTAAFCQLDMEYTESGIDLGCNIVNGNGQSLLDILASASGQLSSRSKFSQQELDANRQMYLPTQNSNGQTILHLAALHGWLSEFSVPGNFNAKDCCGFTPLHSLMARGSEDFDEAIFDLLVKKCNVDAVNMEGQTALHMAVSHDLSNAFAVKGLIKAGASVNAVDNNGDSALMLAVASNNIELIRILLEKGALINAVNFYGQTALWLAAKHPCLGVIKVLLLHGASVNIADLDGVSPLLASIESIGSEGQSMEMEQSQEWLQDMQAVLMSDKDETLVQALLRCGAQPNEPDNDGMTPLVAACQSANLQSVQDLLAARADASLAEAQGQTPLIAAAEQGLLEIVLVLLTAGAEVDAMDSEWQTPLMAAAAEGSLEVVQALLQAGADASHCNEEGTTVLMEALGYIDVMEALVAAGADVNAEDGDGETVLIMAAREADLECVQWLLENGADQDHTTSSGETALHAACAACHEELDYAADIVDLLRDLDLESDGTDSEMCSESDFAEDVSPMDESAVLPASPSAPPLEGLQRPGSGSLEVAKDEAT